MVSSVSLNEIISGGKVYFVPVYQRAFSWTERELKQLISDLEDTYKSSELYYMGSLVLSDRKDGKAEVIDGQQRLTAFSILLALLKNEYHLDAGAIKLEYEIRDSSEEEMQSLRENIIKEGPFSNAYKSLKILVEPIEDKELFFSFLTNKVKLLCTKIPSNIDLNLYFEVMNKHSRELQRSDILRSHCLSILTTSEEKKVFKTLFDASSHFDRYIEEGVSFKLWNRIFYGEARTPLFESTYSEWWSMLESYLGCEEECANYTLSEIIDYESVIKGRREGSDSTSRDIHYSITDFPNFLLLVAATLGYNYPLDDKRMLSSLLSSPLFSSKESIKMFIFNLVRERYLFDRYVIKESEKGSFAILQYLDLHEYRPAFKDIEKTHKCENILLKLMQRHSGNGHLDYLVYILSYLNRNPALSAEEYLAFLEEVVKKY